MSRMVGGRWCAIYIDPRRYNCSQFSIDHTCYFIFQFFKLLSIFTGSGRYCMTLVFQVNKARFHDIPSLVYRFHSCRTNSSTQQRETDTKKLRHRYNLIKIELHAPKDGYNHTNFWTTYVQFRANNSNRVIHSFPRQEGKIIEHKVIWIYVTMSWGPKEGNN